MDVGLHFRQRDAEKRRNLHVALALEVKEDDRHALTRRQIAKRVLELLGIGGRRQIGFDAWPRSLAPARTMRASSAC